MSQSDNYRPKYKQLTSVKPEILFDKPQISLNRCQNTNDDSYTHLVNPLCSFIAKSGLKYSQIQRSKQKQIVIIHEPTNSRFYQESRRQSAALNNFRNFHHSHNTSLPKPLIFNRTEDELSTSDRKLQTQEFQRKKILSVSKDFNSSIQNIDFDENIELNQTSLDEELVQNPEPPKLKKNDPEKTKNVLQNLLITMQRSRHLEIQTEKHMKVFGLQVKSLKISEDQQYRVRSVNIALNQLIQNQRTQTQAAIEKLKFRQKNQMQQENKKEKQVLQISPSKIEKKISIQKHQAQSRPSNFRFSMTRYSQLSREQLFLHKLATYHQFLFIISLQSDCYTTPGPASTLNIFIGRGNNSQIIKEVFKIRWWWQLVDEQEDAHFSWTQIKTSSFHRQQVKFKGVARKGSLGSPQISKTMRESRFGTYENPWHKLVSKEEVTKLLKVDQNLEEFKNYAKKCSIEIIKDGQKMQNHLEKNFHLGNKKALYYNLRQYCEETQRNLFEIVPLTFHIQNGLEDPEYLRFVQIYKEKQSKPNNRTQVFFQEKREVQEISGSLSLVNTLIGEMAQLFVSSQRKSKEFQPENNNMQIRRNQHTLFSSIQIDLFSIISGNLTSDVICSQLQ